MYLSARGPFSVLLINFRLLWDIAQFDFNELD